MLGDEATGIGLVAADRIALTAQHGLHHLRHDADAARAVAVAQHHVGARPLVLGAGVRRHGMAVDQHRGAEVPVHAREQPPQRPMVGLVQPLDAPDGVVDRNALAVDFLGVAHHAGHRAESARHPHGAGIGEGREPAVEHARVELVGLAVHVDIAAREMRVHQRIAAPNDAERELVDEAVLGPAQGQPVEPRGHQERARIHAAAVR